ncbi:uncharacterized protein (TIGR00369 family) [Williamsia muralis]|uniref:Uncharacterized protein (TIGR00369 family) n=1 Tax=Williamsia marianensis TaxID=85044 RepID=A0A495KA79_WILMA|nr:PaaI family thioesterase [Williamsia muralis]RKR97548.1 uncharacterized protein (TIGR00369 family) [Williamsia muralis]
MTEPHADSAELEDAAGSRPAVAAVEPTPVERRFGITIVEADPRTGRSLLTMDVASLENTETGVRSLGPLALMLDGSGGLSNHVVRPDDTWTVTSELSMDLNRAAMVSSGEVVASFRSIGFDSVQALSLTTFRIGGIEVGTGLIRSVFVPARGVDLQRPRNPASPSRHATLLEQLSLRVDGASSGYSLIPMLDPDLNNDIGSVHGGVVAIALELVAVGALQSKQGDSDAHYSGSLRINYLRPMKVGDGARYNATPVRIGRGTAVADSVAIGADGQASAIARVTRYR